MTADTPDTPHIDAYVLDDQVGFILRQVSQRHTTLFAEIMAAATGDESLTPTQFAALAKLRQLGSCSQNELGRETAMDAATIKGVVGRLVGRGLVETWKDAGDARRLRVRLSDAGAALIAAAIPRAFAITDQTLSPLSDGERATLLRLLRKLR
ncbi:MAG: winged helix-turn-helix transcriptional regulator [Hyphomicrobiales bacterium]|nr:winged helix-turn-helix transcriptional regulator [Hyphomicrobiales bacterium]MCP5370359.1 winged helix-turn-helix transcriptional regulator [Hyphomicrobiales bacterium]